MKKIFLAALFMCGVFNPCMAQTQQKQRASFASILKQHKGHDFYAKFCRLGKGKPIEDTSGDAALRDKYPFGYLDYMLMCSSCKEVQIKYIGRQVMKYSLEYMDNDGVKTIVMLLRKKSDNSNEGLIESDEFVIHCHRAYFVDATRTDNFRVYQIEHEE